MTQAGPVGINGYIIFRSAPTACTCQKRVMGIIGSATSSHSGLALFCGFEGEIGRKPFWIGSVSVALLLGLFEIAMRRLVGPHSSAWLPILHAVAMLPLAALAAKRATDRGRSSYWGVMLVLFTVGSGLVASLASHQPGPALSALAAGLRPASALAWLVLLIDLGLMPSRRPVTRRGYRAAA